MITNQQKIGPAEHWENLGSELDRLHPLRRLRLTQTLVTYDGPIVALGQREGDPNTYLRIDAKLDQDSIHTDPKALREILPEGYPYFMRGVIHLLAFPSEETAVATLHEGEIPTLETYRQATRIVREVNSWTLVAPYKVKDCCVEVSDVEAQDIPEGELPYKHLKPGQAMEFAGSTFEELSIACGKHYVWPLPTKEVLAFYDVPRIWIGETEFLNQTKVHLHVMVEEKGGREVCYRLTFSNEQTLRGTLHKGCAPTRESFAKATEIVREELNVAEAPEHWTLQVETVELGRVPETDLPSATLIPSAKPVSEQEAA